MKDERVYQLESTLKKMQGDMKRQSEIMGDMSGVLKEIGQTMKSFQKISSEQARQGVVLKSLERDSKDFKQFIKESQCQTHTAEIGQLKNSDGLKTNNFFTFIIVIAGCLVTGLLTYFTTKN